MQITTYTYLAPVDAEDQQPAPFQIISSKADILYRL